MRVSFSEVSLHGQKSGPCASCGKRRSRSTKFWQTVNPFNQNADGVPKSPSEIRGELLVERDAWMQKPLICRSCEEAAQAAERKSEVG